MLCISVSCTMELTLNEETGQSCLPTAQPQIMKEGSWEPLAVHVYQSFYSLIKKNVTIKHQVEGQTYNKSTYNSFTKG